MKEWMVILLRSFGIFFLLFFLTKTMGKKSIAKLTVFQFINYIVIAVLGAVLSLKLVNNQPLGFVALGVWAFLPPVLDLLGAKSKAFHDFIYGKETVLIKKGKIMEENLRKSKLTGEDLIRELRSKNAFNLADVEFAVLETSGEINLTLKTHKKPISPHDIGKKVGQKAEPQTVILDGNILHDGLNNLGLNQGWLQGQLADKGVDLSNVFVGQVDSSGDLYLDLFDDLIEMPQSNPKELLYANIEKSQADFAKYALETEDMMAQEMYQKNALELEKMMDKLQAYLLH